VQRVMKQDELYAMLQSMGFTPEVIQECIRGMHVTRGRRTVIDANALIEKLLRFQSRSARSDIDDDLLYHEPPPLPENVQQELTQDPKLDEVLENLNQDTEEKVQWSDSACCKICFERPIETCILRCGHLALCSKCSVGLRHCPICRKVITEIVRIYHV